MLESKTPPGGQPTEREVVCKVPDSQAGDGTRATRGSEVVSIQPSHPIARLRGIVQHTGPVLSLRDMDRAIAKRACES